MKMNFQYAEYQTSEKTMNNKVSYLVVYSISLNIDLLLFYRLFYMYMFKIYMFDIYVRNAKNIN